MNSAHAVQVGTLRHFQMDNFLLSDYQSCNLNALTCPAGFICVAATGGYPYTITYPTPLGIGICCRGEAKCPNAPLFSSVKTCSLSKRAKLNFSFNTRHRSRLRQSMRAWFQLSGVNNRISDRLLSFEQRAHVSRRPAAISSAN